MFSEYGDTEVFEDDLYSEGSSSETGIDSEVEFHLYSQVHYAQDLEDVREQDNKDVKGQDEVKSVKTQKPDKQDQSNNFIVISDSDIHISDSPDVITLSDTPDEDSIYKSKLQKLTTPVSLTSSKFSKTACSLSSKSMKHPSQILLNSKEQVTETSSKEGKADPKTVCFNQDKVHVIRSVLVIEDSSSNEDAVDVTSITSESDNVESWMLLGSARDDKDDDILLNLEGCGTSASEGEDRTNWTISDKDIQAQIGNYVTVRHNNRYYIPDKNVTCRNCDKRGHLSKNCPAPKKIPPCCLCAQRGHLQNSCPARFCLNCCLPGHFSRECPERIYWKKHCNRCDMRGHYADACPEIWRQYHLTTRAGPLKKAKVYSDHSASVYCYNCAKKGHYGFECSEKRMFGGILPAVPFIYYYDNEYDIKRSSQRAKKKVQELQEAGLLPQILDRPYLDYDHEDHNQKKRRKMLKEHDKRRDKYHKKLEKKLHADAFKERKHKRESQSSYKTEEYFPRGGQVKALKRCRRKASVHQSMGFPTNCETEAHQDTMVPAKKQKKKQRNCTSHDSIRDESLFLIKQKKKKSKHRSS